jgi:anti-sigma B factor antagonist
MPGDATRAVVVMLDGEFDIARTADLRHSILGAHKDEPLVIVDMSCVTFVDSSALRGLLEVHGVLAEHSAVMTIRNPSPVVRRLLDLVGMSEMFGLGG